MASTFLAVLKKKKKMPEKKGHGSKKKKKMSNPTAFLTSMARYSKK